MNYTDLWADISTREDCAPYITPSEPKVDAAVAQANDQSIADLINVGRTRIVSHEIGDGSIALALGTPAGPLFLYQLETLASTLPAADATPEQVAMFAVARQAWRSISKGSLDVGAQGVRDGIAMFIGTLLTIEQAGAILSLAEVPDPVTAADVSRAVRGPRE